jgi:HNH endonuclease.
VNHYGEEALNKINLFVKKIYPEYESVFDISSYTELLSVKAAVFRDPEFSALDSRGNNMYSAGFNRYIEFADGRQFISKEKYLQLLDAKEPVRYSSFVKEKSVPTRDRIKILQVEQACNYKCQIDYSHKTFIARGSGHQYMEGHHIIPLNQQKDFDYSLDCYANIIVLCPNCHRFMHHGLEKEKREQLISIYEGRVERFSNSGILLDRPEFLERVESASHLYVE